LLKNKSLAINDSSLVWYWDMETTTLSWSTTVLKDLSKYGNHWACYYNWSSVNCWAWPLFVTWNGNTWNAMSFDWKWVVVINNNSNKKTLQNWTRAILVNSSISSSWDTAIHDFWTERTTTDKLLFRIDNLWRYNFHYKSWVSFPNINVNRTENKYDFIVAVKDWTSENVYINWTKVSSIASSDNFADDNNQIFMWATTNLISQTYIWIIDEVRIYNRALSESEISNLYNSIK
jgi:hypothetical protein